VRERGEGAGLREKRVWWDNQNAAPAKKEDATPMFPIKNARKKKDGA